MLLFVATFLFVSILSNSFAADLIEFEYQRYDGWYNNPANIKSASIGNSFKRLVPSNYSDNVYQMDTSLPSPQQLADILTIRDPNEPSTRNTSAVLGFYAQFILYEVSSTSPGCPVEVKSIDVRKEKNDSVTTKMLFRRSSYDKSTGESAGSPREQLNHVTPIIDGSIIYGSSTPAANSIRTFENGTVSMMGHFASPLADGRVNENPAIFALVSLFRGFHNHVADELYNKLLLDKNVNKKEKAKVSKTSDEYLFQVSRKITISVLQKITLYEFLPTLLNLNKTEFHTLAYKAYDGSVDPRVSHEFVTAAGKYFYTLIPPGIILGNGSVINSCNYGTNAIETMKKYNATIEQILFKLSQQLSEKDDSFIVNGNGLIVNSALVGRDHGVPSYKEIRKQLIGGEIPGTVDKVLKSNNLTDVDLFIGGILESTGSGPGELFKRIIIRTFENIRNGDRFWYENNYELLEQLGFRSLVDGMTLGKLIKLVYKMDIGDAFITSHGTFLDHGAIDYDHCDPPLKEQESKDMRMLILAALILGLIFPALSFGLVKIAYKRQEIKEIYMKDEGKHIRSIIANDPNYFVIYAQEWLHEKCNRTVRVGVDNNGISTFGPNSFLLRKIPFTNGSLITIKVSNEESRNKPFVLISRKNDHDLVLQFTSILVRGRFLFYVEACAMKTGVVLDQEHLDTNDLLKNAETKEKRKKKLSVFFRKAYAMAIGSDDSDVDRNSLANFPPDVRNVLETFITKSEFADALGMKVSSPFVGMMFNVCDVDGDNKLSFMEFLNTIMVFVRGKSKDKLAILFKMCDEDGTGIVPKAKLAQIFISLVDDVKSSGVQNDESRTIVNDLFNSVPDIAAKENLTYDEFQLLMADKSRSKSIKMGLHLPGAQRNFIGKRKVELAPSFNYAPSSILLQQRKGFIQRHFDTYQIYVEHHRQMIVLLMVFVLFVIFFFTERFMHFYFMVEHTDIRHFAGFGVPLARGAGAVISFTFGLIPLTVCNHIMAMMRKTCLYQYVPIDAAIELHKVIAMTAMIFSAIHSFAYLSIFYDFASEPAEFMACIFPDNDCERQQLPFKYWFFGTLPGITGIILFLLMMVLFSFAHPRVRSKAYKYFWLTHKLFWVIYGLILIHGLERLTGNPRFYQFIIPAFIIFMIDRIISWRTRSMRLKIIDTVLHPSDVVEVRFARPASFDYLSGQWIRLRCTDLDGSASQEYHSFTLTSAPHERFLSCHIKATGPWTWKLRNYFDPGNINHDRDSGKCLMSIDGPFGGGNQEWFKYDVAIMVGGGIGITPYASILKDLVFGTSTSRYSGVACTKVYFLWICSSHKHFEWFIELLKEVERLDTKGVLEMHIFITKLYDKFDLRTMMLYICENHLKKIGKKSLFTGLSAKNHFGRPDLVNFFSFVRSKHPKAGKIGIFSCGPSAMTSSVDVACNKVNERRLNPYFVHKYENFG